MTKAETVFQKLAGDAAESVIKGLGHFARKAITAEGEEAVTALGSHIKLHNYAMNNAQSLGFDQNVIKVLKQGKVDLNSALEKRWNKIAEHFVQQHHPAKVKEVYKALERKHPEYSAGKKARIANYVGKK